jgi:biotin transport system substrate-specific component
MGLFVALMCVAAWMRVPLPTPAGVTYVTLQTAVAILAALLLRPREAFITMASYVALGLVGLPVFANPGYAGLGYVASPTFGYLVGFVLGAPLGAKYLNRTVAGSYPVPEVRGMFPSIETGPGSRPGAQRTSGQCLIAGLVVVIVTFVCGLGYLWGYARWVLGTPVSAASLLSITSAILWAKDSALAALIAPVAPRLRAHIEG